MKKMLLHSCCAPCSSTVLTQLAEAGYEITIFYYNPNIDNQLEYMRRAEELERLKNLPLKHGFKIVVEEYKPDEYNEAVKGLESLGEGSERCYECYKLRLIKTAKYASENRYDAFATTLSVSPYKNIDWINKIGYQLEEKFGVVYLDENFRKNDGYKRSIDLSKQLGMYRQDYCGCKYSKIESTNRRNRA